MGHERVGELPRTRRWGQIVNLLGLSGSSELGVADVSGRTLEAVGGRLEGLKADAALSAAFGFFVEVSCAAGMTAKQRQAAGLGDPASLGTAMSALQQLRSRLARSDSLPEYRALVERAAGRTLAEWYRAAAESRSGLLPGMTGAVGPWERAANGAGFCELSRRFLGNVVSGYLQYFLDREASNRLPSLAQRKRYREALEQHVEEVSRHAFETAKITQSFAAGWFNRHAREGPPSHAETRGFVAFAMAKLQEELRRERRS